MDLAKDIVQRSHLASETLQTSSFPLFSAHHVRAAQASLVDVVIEGDGYAWVNRYRISDNPTPKNPVGLRIAESLATQNDVVYLGRPCQYVKDVSCDKRYWTSSRYAPEVMQAYMDALDQIAVRYGVQEFRLIGFSGGAYLSLALAARRDDVAKVTAVAGLMDPDAWAAHHDISLLRVVAAPEVLLRGSSQTDFHHVCGTDDDILPCSLAQDFVKRAESLGLINHRVSPVHGADHQSIWIEAVQMMSLE